MDLDTVGAVRQQHHSDVATVGGPVVDHPVDGCDDLRDIDRPVVGSYFHTHDVGGRSHAGEGAGGVSGHDAGEVGSVPESIERQQVREWRLEGEVRTMGDPPGQT